MIISVGRLSRRMRVKHELIAELVHNKKVIHYGCIDDDEKLIRLKHKGGYYLHQIVTDSSESTTGVDFNKSGIKFLKDELNISNVEYGNVEDLSTYTGSKVSLKRAEILLVPDLIEHLRNPGGMLDDIKKYYSEDVKVLITTPNPFAWYNFIATLCNLEIYSPYHTMHFSIQNTKILLENSGFRVDKVTPVFIPKQRSIIVRLLDSLMSRVAVLISPGFSDSFLYECSVIKEK